MRAGAARMDDALWNAFVIEMRDLFAQDKILEQERPARPGLHRVLVIGNRNALICAQGPGGIIRGLMRLRPLRQRFGAQVFIFFHEISVMTILRSFILAGFAIKANARFADRFLNPRNGLYLSRPEPQRRRRDIFVETKAKTNLQPHEGGIFRESFVERFENVSRFVFPAEYLQQLFVFSSPPVGQRSIKV